MNTLQQSTGISQSNVFMQSSLQIRLFGIVLDTYWQQFARLKERLEGYLQVVE